MFPVYKVRKKKKLPKDDVNTRVVKDGHTTRYLQRYLKDWESQPQFTGNSEQLLNLYVG